MTKLLLPSNSACIDNYGRNQLRHLKQFLGPDYEDSKKTKMKPTGQGASIMYQLIHENNALQKENNMLLKNYVQETLLYPTLMDMLIQMNYSQCSLMLEKTCVMFVMI